MACTKLFGWLFHTRMYQHSQGTCSETLTAQVPDSFCSPNGGLCQTAGDKKEGEDELVPALCLFYDQYGLVRMYHVDVCLCVCFACSTTPLLLYTCIASLSHTHFFSLRPLHTILPTTHSSKPPLERHRRRRLSHRPRRLWQRRGGPYRLWRHRGGQPHVWGDWDRRCVRVRLNGCV